MNRVRTCLLTGLALTVAHTTSAGTIMIDSFCSGAQTASLTSDFQLNRTEVAAGPNATCGGAIGGYRVVDALGSGVPPFPVNIGVNDASNAGRVGVVVNGGSVIHDLYIGWDGVSDGGLFTRGLNADLTAAGLNPYFELGYVSDVPLTVLFAIASNGGLQSAVVNLTPVGSSATLSLAQFVGANLADVDMIFMRVQNLGNTSELLDTQLRFFDLRVIGTDGPTTPPEPQVPEPATVVLTGIAMLGAIRRARR